MPTSRRPKPRRPQPAATLFYGTVIGIHVGLLILDLSPVLAAIEQQYQVDHALAGWAISATLITHTLAQIPGGDWGERFGPKAVLLAAIALMAVSILMRALADSFNLLVLSRLVTGLGTGLGFVGGVQLIAATSPAGTQARDQGILGSSQHFGIMAAMLLLPLVNASIGLPAFYLADAALLVLLLVAFAWHYPSPPPLASHRSTPPTSWPAAFRTRLSIELGLANIMSYAAYMTMVAWTAAFLQERFGTGPAVTATLAMAITFSGFLGRLTGGFIAQRWGSRAVIFGGSAAAFLFIMLIPVAGELLPTVAVLLVAAYCGNVAFGPIFGSARTMSSHAGFGRRLAVIVILSNTAAFVLPLVIGYILRFSGSFQTAFWFLGLSVLAVWLVLSRWGQIDRRLYEPAAIETPPVV